ncbi:HAD hydrolase-like protein [Oerskovia douganii]|uniref:HAD hydrolase-like protein n=1 Tax=Oerskovia douganii TaxID=2762210 RepID=UPI002AAFCC40|nr:HAD hydrolase-like protein [Oerskovia douganii]
MTTANPPYRLALLDLDGTLTDSAPGILSSIRHAYGALGIQVPTDETLQSFVGPPLAETFARHGVPADRVPEAVAASTPRGACWRTPSTRVSWSA